MARRLELAPILPGVGPDGTRHWPVADRQRATFAALARLLPRLEEGQAAALHPAQRRWLAVSLERAGARPDTALGRELLHKQDCLPWEQPVIGRYVRLRSPYATMWSHECVWRL
ncbi:MAG: hypothetical protein QM758_26310 [Armatimonas sp.]